MSSEEKKELRTILRDTLEGDIDVVRNTTVVTPRKPGAKVQREKENKLEYAGCRAENREDSLAKKKRELEDIGTSESYKNPSQGKEGGENNDGQKSKEEVITRRPQGNHT